MHSPRILRLQGFSGTPEGSRIVTDVGTQAVFDPH